ncbi:hypothetical protein Tco_1054072 [Tanacetum coccineum]|uniref:Uncharacterized protein n=1 Tax=Tanacetum coccineum TaxID=301880 RepID=A0ABQ5GVR6_9ASTR
MSNSDDESDSGDLTTDVVEDISGDSTRKLQISHRDFKALKISHNFLIKEAHDGLSEETCQSWMYRISISILLDQLKYGGSSQARDSVNKNKALSTLLGTVVVIFGASLEVGGVGSGVVCGVGVVCLGITDTIVSWTVSPTNKNTSKERLRTDYHSPHDEKDWRLMRR